MFLNMKRRGLATLLSMPAAVLALCVCLPGCGGSSGAHVPTESTARQALEATLSAWKSGQSVETLAALTPAVHAVDSHWQAGRTLASYEILNEEPGETERQLRRSGHGD